ncbi:hypothetical protein GCM10010399_85080 [Dactylosporangium fulvum]|uniref:Uncharacterized protein n=1 Tax=Dactylosporangium fulvum TaxID=53359 RepID=A0ABY5W4T7_9ACTN|nr:hypothetical protein [Dactylosporangium fulvum]UWP84552.1 hypothetical protein Dfulv_10090 [Dactylosporangium fulvum]
MIIGNIWLSRSLLRNSPGQRWRPNYAPILELWRHEPPNLSGFVKDHNSKIGEVVGVDARGIRIARQAPRQPDVPLIYQPQPHHPAALNHRAHDRETFAITERGGWGWPQLRPDSAAAAIGGAAVVECCDQGRAAGLLHDHGNTEFP